VTTPAPTPTTSTKSSGGGTFGFLIIFLTSILIRKRIK
jgi:hypothetical protein